MRRTNWAGLVIGLIVGVIAGSILTTAMVNNGVLADPIFKLGIFFIAGASIIGWIVLAGSTYIGYKYL